MPTSRQQLTLGTWTNLGPGPMYLQNRSNDPVYYIIDSVAPTVPGGTDIADMPQHRLGGEGESRDISINFTQNVYARGAGSVLYSK